MEKTINVSIGGVAFILESQAYMLLKDYTVKIEGGYRENPDGAEILSDIESRISELILTRQSSEQVVPAALIKEIIEQLGLPDDLSEPSDKKIDDTATPANEEIQYKSSINKRLYRNPDGAKLGGVCSGLGAYFNVDPVWIRLLFFLPLILVPVFGFLQQGNGNGAGFWGVMFGVGFMLYFILWIVIPKARTPLQKLEMTGTKITASSIEQKFYDDFSDRNTPLKSEKQASVLSEILYIIGNIILFCLKALLLLIGLVFGVAAIAVIIIYIVVFVGGFSALAAGQGLEWLSTLEYVTVAVSGALLIILPMWIFGYLLFKLVFNLPKQTKTLAIISGIWVIILVFLSIFVVRNIDNIKNFGYEWEFQDGRFKKREIHVDWNKVWNGRENSDKNIQVLSDSTTVESINVGDSTVMDTIRKEYYTR